jgi:anti-sigma B factor antagonist
VEARWEAPFLARQEAYENKDQQKLNGLIRIKVPMDLHSKSMNNIKVLTITGRFDALTSPDVQTWLEEATKTRPVHIVVNLGAVTFIDSTALSTLVAGMKRARQADGDLRLCKLQQPVRMIFELTRLDRAFEIFPGEDEAVGAFIIS